jgi:outer membrane murein-binding lipoprotein Lpp
LNDEARDLAGDGARSSSWIGVLRRDRLTFGLSVGVVVLFVALVAMVILSAVNYTEATQAQQQRNEYGAKVRDLESKTAELEGRVELYEPAYNKASELERAEQALDQREADVAAREAAVKSTEDRIAATTLKDGFTYTVGSTMEPGTYQANSTTENCYWAIYTTGSNYSDIVDNGFAAGIVSVTVGPGQDFTSKRCGDWSKVG